LICRAEQVSGTAHFDPNVWSGRALQEVSSSALRSKVWEKDVLELIARSAETVTAMAGMLTTLLDINQLEAGVVQPHIVDFPINELLETLGRLDIRQ
jgi:hypothetical protein